jgi:serine phosphatase RsbU (regulator of sigma subunit)/ABC-type amino acid transport substrate-binding protein
MKNLLQNMRNIPETTTEIHATRHRLHLVLLTVALISIHGSAFDAYAQEDTDKGGVKVSLTQEEQAWLVEHPTIRVAPDPDAPPFEFFDTKGVYRGITADYLALLEDRLDIEFQVVREESWSEILAKAKEREIDMLSAAMQTLQRSEYLNFTAPHIRLPGVIIATTDTRDTLTLAKLRGKKVAVVSGYVWHELLTTNHPDIVLVPVPNITSALQMTSFKIVDAMVGDQATTTYFIGQEGLANLRMAGKSGYQYEMGIATRKDWPHLNTILEKALATITSAERAQITHRWIQLRHKPLWQKRGFWIGLGAGVGAVLLIIAAILIWNRALSRQVAKGIEKLAKETAARARMQQDLEIARSIQQGLLPHQMLDIEGFDIAGWNQPADQTGGDYFDWQEMPDGRAAISLADVTGHGIGPALCTAFCRAYSRASIPSESDLGTAMDRINNMLVEDLPVERFVTFVVALLDPTNSKVQLLSAGHGPILLYTASDNNIQDFDADDIPLGINPNVGYGPAREIKLAGGDMLVLITDGFFEWTNAEGEMFGLERLQESIRKHKDLPAKEIISRLYKEVVKFTGGTEHEDDLTAVILKQR